MKSLFQENPLLAEVVRVNRRLIGVGAKGHQIAAGILAGIVYFCFMGMVMWQSTSVPPQVLMYVMTGILLLVVPINLHGVIAGEREKRSLDMLLVAPVTSQQIVAAKFLRASGLFVAVVAGFLLPALFLALVQSATMQDSPLTDVPGWRAILAGLAVGIPATFFGGALTLCISAYTKSSVAALVASIGAHFFLLALTPMFFAALQAAAPGMGEFFFHFHPFWALAVLTGDFTESVAGSGPLASAPLAMLAVVLWTLGGLFCLNLARVRIDQERK